MKHGELLIISLGIFLTVVAWVISDLYHTGASAKMKVKYELPQTINYDLDIKSLEDLKLRQQ